MWPQRRAADERRHARQCGAHGVAETVRDDDLDRGAGAISEMSALTVYKIQCCQCLPFPPADLKALFFLSEAYLFPFGALTFNAAMQFGQGFQFPYWPQLNGQLWHATSFQGLGGILPMRSRERIRAAVFGCGTRLNCKRGATIELCPQRGPL
jgi:hypothetical protein